MIIYNVTTNIDNNVREEWLQWMKDKHIPDVMATGHFMEYRFCKVLVDEEQGTTYSAQYTCATMKDLEEYRTKHGPRLQKEVADKYGDKAVSFRTLLEVI
jgi:hypothetical protein